MCPTRVKTAPVPGSEGRLQASPPSPTCGHRALQALTDAGLVDGEHGDQVLRAGGQVVQLCRRGGRLHHHLEQKMPVTEWAGWGRGRGLGRAGLALAPCVAASLARSGPSVGARGCGLVAPRPCHPSSSTCGPDSSPACVRGGPLTSLGAPPLEGRNTIRYLRGGRGAGVQDRWMLEEVTRVRTRPVGAERGSRAGAAAAGVTVGWEGAAGDSGSACAPGGRFPEGQCSPRYPQSPENRVGGAWWGCGQAWATLPSCHPCWLTWAAAQAPALHLLTDEAAEQAGQRAELAEVLHAVHGDVQRLGRQEPQLGIIGVLHACRGVGASCLL